MTAQTLTLADFLAARFDEDEGWAPTRHTLLCLRTGCETCIFGDDEDTIAAERVCTCGYPARVLAECEAKRRIVEAFKDAERAVAGYDDNNPNNPPSYWQEWGNRHALELALEVLAQPYASHPDFNPDWR
jgi:hypothetical protein